MSKINEKPIDESLSDHDVLLGTDETEELSGGYSLINIYNFAKDKLFDLFLKKDGSLPMTGTLIGSTGEFTGQVKSIDPVDGRDLITKQYVDLTYQAAAPRTEYMMMDGSSVMTGTLHAGEAIFDGTVQGVTPSDGPDIVTLGYMDGLYAKEDLYLKLDGSNDMIETLTAIGGDFDSIESFVFTDSNHAITKDKATSDYLKITGGAVGSITGESASFSGKSEALYPVSDTDLVTKLYIDEVVLTSFLPIGSIVLWNNSLSSIPEGWVLCDEQSGIPIANKFILATGDVSEVGETGGDADSHPVTHTHTVGFVGNDPGTHNHQLLGVLTDVDGQEHGNADDPRMRVVDTPFVSETPPVPTGTIVPVKAGSLGTNKNLPPYISIPHIVRIS